MDHSDFERTMIHAEAAVSQFKANKTPAYPTNYELWYTYSCGFNHGLNKAINDILRKNGKISPEQIQTIYEQHLSSAQLQNRVERVGSMVGSEIGEITTILDTALDSAGEYDKTLSGAAQSLVPGSEPQRVAEVMKTLITSTKEMQASNLELKSKLNESKQQIEELQESIESIRFQSLTDELTGMSNRKCFDQNIETILSEAETSGQPLSLLLADIDHFKAFNDTHGHQTGDQVLRLVGHTLRNQVKGRDLAARYGGEEFVIILPNTPLDQAVKVAENIRKAIHNKELVKRSTGETLGRVTMSIGVVANQPEDTSEAIIHRADICLYAAKGNGRNCVISQDEPGLADLSKVA